MSFLKYFVIGKASLLLKNILKMSFKDAVEGLSKAIYQHYEYPFGAFWLNVLIFRLYLFAIFKLRFPLIGPNEQKINNLNNLAAVEISSPVSGSILREKKTHPYQLTKIYIYKALYTNFWTDFGSHTSWLTNFPNSC